MSQLKENINYFILLSLFISTINCETIPCDIGDWFDCECTVLDPPSSSITPFSQSCPLVWQFMSSGDALPAKGIQSESGGPHFAVRVIRDQKYYVGSYDIVKRSAYFTNFRNETEKADSFEILSNPHNCSIHWREFIVGSPKEHKPKFVVPISNEVYMARYFNEEDETWVPGAITITGNGVSSLGYVFGEVRNVTYPQILQSYSAGLNLEVFELVMATENLFDVTSWDFMEVDEIRNDGSGIVEVELSHFKQVVRHYGLSFNANLSATVIVNIDLIAPINDLPIPSCISDVHCRIEILKCTSSVDVIPTFFRRTETVPMKVIRRVTIPPYAHVESCSIVKYVQKVDIEFTARGKYHVKGWTGEEVRQLLVSEGVIFDYVGNDYVALDMSGKYSFSLALNTKFFIGAFDTLPCWNLGTRMGMEANGDFKRNLIVLNNEDDEEPEWP